MERILDQVKTFAEQAHGRQRRKFVDEAYINHPIRVMKTCRQYSNSSSMAAAALLHDVLEDTPVTEDELKTFLASVMDESHAGNTYRLVKDLTDIYTHAKYPQWNRRKRKQREFERLSKAHPDAQTIKYADIIDNSVDVAGSGDDFAQKYLNECRALLTYINKGNPELHNLAIETVQKSLNAIADLPKKQ